MMLSKIVGTIFKVLLIVGGFTAIIFGAVWDDPYYTILGVLYLIWFDVTVIGEKGVRLNIYGDKGIVSNVTVSQEKGK